jgi:hypothetical protein
MIGWIHSFVSPMTVALLLALAGSLVLMTLIVKRLEKV